MPRSLTIIFALLIFQCICSDPIAYKKDTGKISPNAPKAVLPLKNTSLEAVRFHTANSFRQKRYQTLSAGQRVRITAQSEISGFRRIGNIVKMDEDTLVVKSRYGRPIAIPLASIGKLELSRNKIRKTRRGLLIGTGIGASLTLASVSLANEMSTASLVTVAGFHGLLGAAIGAVIVSDRWEEAPREGVSAGILPGNEGRMSLVLSYGF